MGLWGANMIDKDLCTTMLPVPMILKNYVKENVLCDYELYLRELINESRFFLNLSNGEKYVQPNSESNGEPDAISLAYSLDFKLLESASLLEAQRQFSLGISMPKPGFHCYSVANRKGSTITVELHVALRLVKDISYFDEIWNEKPRSIQMFKRTSDNGEEQAKADMYKYVNDLRHEKNLLFFIPRIFYFNKNEKSFGEATRLIAEALTCDFLLSCQYRDSLEYENIDTYFSCIYRDFFLIFQFVGNGIIFVDSVSLSKSSTYQELYITYSHGAF